MSIWKPPACQHDGCRKPGVLHYRLNPTNWAERRQRLCPEHGKKDGYTKVSHERAARAGTKLPQRGTSTT